MISLRRMCQLILTISDCWLPVGKPLELRDEKEGLFIKGKISDTSMGKDVKILLRDGVLGELSIGYDPVVFDYDENGIPPPTRSQVVGGVNRYLGNESGGSHYRLQIPG